MKKKISGKMMRMDAGTVEQNFRNGRTNNMKNYFKILIGFIVFIVYIFFAFIFFPSQFIASYNFLVDKPINKECLIAETMATTTDSIPNNCY